MINKKELELYFHIPFCIRKCLYCDFLSGPAEDTVKHAYMEAIRTELRERAKHFGDYIVVSVFVGGGTPSVVEAGELAALLTEMRTCFHMAEDVEITVEVNPGTVTGEKLAQYWAAGVNRLSIGLQTAMDEELLRIGRIHSWQQFCETYALAVEKGFQNINVDVMSTLPGQSVESYCETLNRVLALKPQPVHISAYSLIVEEGTQLYELIQAGELEEPDEDTDRFMYTETKRILEAAGFQRYEISNYAKPGYECRHNCGYWTGREYLGLGLGAASLVGSKRFRNGASIKAYLENPTDCREEEQVLTREEQMEEFMYLGLRMTCGVSLQEFLQRFGVEMEEVYGEVIARNLKDGLLELYEDGEKNHRRLALTERGLDLSNYCMAQFLLT